MFTEYFKKISASVYISTYSNKKLISPTESFEEDVIHPCPVVALPILPTSSFGKNIRLDLTGYGDSSTPVSGDR